MDQRHIGYEIKSLNRRIGRIINNIPAVRQNKNITSIQLWVLNFLFREKGRDLFQRDIEAEFNIRRSTATEILKLMEKNGLIRREPVDYDARLKKIVLLPYASELREQLEDRVARTEAKLTDGFSEEEIESFYGFIRRFQENLSNLEKNLTLGSEEESQKTPLKIV